MGRAQGRAARTREPDGAVRAGAPGVDPNERRRRGAGAGETGLARAAGEAETGGRRDKDVEPLPRLAARPPARTGNTYRGRSEITDQGERRGKESTRHDLARIH